MVACDLIAEDKSPGPMTKTAPSKARRTYTAAEFDEVVRRHEKAILELVQRLTRDRTQALDITQEVFIQAFRNIDRFRGQSSIFTWLYRIALNQCRAEYRKAKAKRRIHFVRLVTDGEHANAKEIPSDSPAPEENFQVKERGAIIRNVVSQLNDTLRDVSILRDMEGHSYEEVADRLSIPVGTVRSRLHRARFVLREALKDVI